MRATRVLLVAVAVVLATVACGGDNSSSSTTTTAGGDETTTSEATTTTSGETTTTAAIDITDPTPLLLTATDLPADGFAESPWKHATSPAPCASSGDPSIDDQLAPMTVVGRDLQHALPALLREEIRVYQDETEAGAAYELGRQGLDCSAGTAYNEDGTTSPLTIGAPTDVASAVGAPTATAWQVSTDELQGVLVAAVLDQALVTFEFVTTKGTDTTSVGDPLAIAKLGIEKVKAG